MYMLVELPSGAHLLVVLQRLRGRSSRLLRQEFPYLGCLPTLWRWSWFVSMVGGVPVEVVRRYVENQRRVV